MQNLFGYEDVETGESERILNRKELDRNEFDIHDVSRDNKVEDSTRSDLRTTSDVIKIVWFYENKSFEEFFPKK
jgi:hypothetical protein